MALSVVALLPIIKTGIEEAWKWRKGKALAESESQDELSKAFELAVRLAGSVLIELSANIERVRLISSDAKVGKVTYGVFDFAISDSLMPRLCEVLPTPALLGELHFAMSAVRRVAFYQSIGAAAPMLEKHDEVLGTTTEEDLRGFARAIAFADDALNKGLIDRFNTLREIVAGIGEAALGVAWPALEGGFLPDRVDASGPIRHPML